MNHKMIWQEIGDIWDKEILEQLSAYVSIPNKSPNFDPHWQQNGHMDKAMDLVVAWCRRQPIKGMKLQVHRLPGRTPLLTVEIPGSLDRTVLLYGHIDKQPEMKGWDADKGPWKAVIEGDKLYGRGAADDGYAVFSAMTAIATLQRHHIPHARCLVVIEASEESGSPDLPHYLDHLGKEIGNPDLIICLDSGCGNYETLWSTTSLRGIVCADLHVKILRMGIHSGTGSGVVPGWYYVVNQLIDRIVDPLSGQVRLKELQAQIPAQHVQQATVASQLLGEQFLETFPFQPGVRPVQENLTELLLNQSWRAALSITGIEGLPPLKDAGNVSLPDVSLKLSLRIPPNCEGEKASRAIKQALETSPPHNTVVSLTNLECGNGWVAPALAPWLKTATNDASRTYFGKEAAYFGEGGSIPFMGMLGKKFPQAQFLITGVLGPKSNAHGPNEFLHLPTAKKITAAIASVIKSHYETFA